MLESLGKGRACLRFHCPRDPVACQQQAASPSTASVQAGAVGDGVIGAAEGPRDNQADRG